MITLYDKGGHMPLLWTHLIPATLEGRATHNVQNAMFAAAMAFSLGIKLDAIRQGLRTFDTTFFQAPGPHERLQRASLQGALRLRAQRARGRGAWRTWRSASTSPGRRIVVLAGPGDRRDEDLVAIAQAVAGRFDHYICRRDDDLRERGPDEVPRIQAAALQRRRRAVRMRSRVIPDEQEAIDAALHMGAAGGSAADLRRRAGALLEADHQVQARGAVRRTLPAGPAPRCPTRTAMARITAPIAPPRGGPSTGREVPPPAFSLEGLIRDERGVRFAPEAED